MNDYTIDPVRDHAAAYRGGAEEDFIYAETLALIENAGELDRADRDDLLAYAVSEEGELVRVRGTRLVALLGIVVSGETESAAYAAWVEAAWARCLATIPPLEFTDVAA